jgi:hypothetical protein
MQNETTRGLLIDSQIRSLKKRLWGVLFHKSLCILCALCVCGGEFIVRKTHHRDTENTEGAQSTNQLRTLMQMMLRSL